MVASILKASSWLAAVLAGSLQIHAIDGTPMRPLEPDGVANVLLFVATDCPVSNSYAPEIQRICGAYESSGIRCALIYEEPGVTPRAVRQHLDEYQYRNITAAIDADGALASRVHASITPEAVVVDRRGAIRYRGRIDNFYAALGRPRQSVTAHDLRDALGAIAAGRRVASPETEPVGCYIVPRDVRRQ
jgi:hypothetical protein